MVGQNCTALQKNPKCCRKYDRDTDRETLSYPSHSHPTKMQYKLDIHPRDYTDNLLIPGTERKFEQFAD